MKKLLFILMMGLLAACGDESGSTKKDEVAVESKPAVEVEDEQSEGNENKSEVSNVKPLTLEKFNDRYELDIEYSEPFIDGKFELKDGSIINADWYFYLEGETFDYASAKFIQGQLVAAQLELKGGVTKEDVLNELGLPSDVVYELNEVTNVVDIVIDERFNDANIKRLPNEWD